MSDDKVTPDANPASRKRPVKGKPDGSDNVSDKHYRDRPANDGRFGDGNQEPKSGFPINPD